MYHFNLREGLMGRECVCVQEKEMEHGERNWREKHI